jgi:hypothetical protein
MRFTRRTYRKAIRRSLDREYHLFAWYDPRWHDQLRHTRALQNRARREGHKL